MKKSSVQVSATKLNVLLLASKIVEITKDSGEVAISKDVKPYAKEMAKRLGMTEMQALLLSVFVDNFTDSRINIRDISNHFDVRPIKILTLTEDIDYLVDRGAILRKKDSDGDITYRVPKEVVERLLIDSLPEPEPLTGLDAQEVMDNIADLLKLKENLEIEDADLHARINMLIENNQELQLCQRLKSLHLDPDDLLLFLIMCNLYIANRDEHIRRCDFDDFFCRRVYHRHANSLENGTHSLMYMKLVEYSMDDGQVETDAWRITNYSKDEILADLKLRTKTNKRSNVTHHEDIVAKTLYYNASVTRQVDDLRNLLDGEKMQRVMTRLKDKGMRRGFTCLFYGGPGTGKTETAMQLAKSTGRDVLLVDVPNIRSKWVGETEKNIKEIFERYGSMARNNDLAPILLFNEADALLNKRAEGATGSVDKMENAMQNIILQEMENLEGIMIATTNLTGSLDAAFERRFLYKIEFEKPTPAERRHIWQSMLPDLKEEDALSLAEQFDFSGGQIENIARKRIVSDILAERDVLDLDAIKESCKAESLTKRSAKRIGF